MGRKSREKKQRIRKGDVIKLSSGNLFLPPGYYLIEHSFGDLLSYRVGGIYGGFHKDLIGAYKRIDQEKVSIDWGQEEKKLQEHYDAMASEDCFEEVDRISMDDNPLFEDAVVKKLKSFH